MLWGWEGKGDVTRQNAVFSADSACVFVETWLTGLEEQRVQLDQFCCTLNYDLEVGVKLVGY